MAYCRGCLVVCYPFFEYDEVGFFLRLPEPVAGCYFVPVDFVLENGAEDVEFEGCLGGFAVTAVEHVFVVELMLGECAEVGVEPGDGALGGGAVAVEVVEHLDFGDRVIGDGNTKIPVVLAVSDD